MDELTVRPARPSDWPRLRAAIVELQEHERRLHDARLPGEAIADAYLAWMLDEAAKGGALFIAEVDGAFAGFAAGWVVNEDNVAETADSNRFGLVSDVCVMEPYRGRRIASRLLDAMEAHFRAVGVSRIRVRALAANSAARKSYERSGFEPYEAVYEKIVASKRD